MEPHLGHSYTKDRKILVNRLRRLEGQVRGIARMVDREELLDEGARIVRRRPEVDKRQHAAKVGHTAAARETHLRSRVRADHGVVRAVGHPDADNLVAAMAEHRGRRGIAPLDHAIAVDQHHGIHAGVNQRRQPFSGRLEPHQSAAFISAMAISILARSASTRSRSASLRSSTICASASRVA